MSNDASPAQALPYESSHEWPQAALLWSLVRSAIIAWCVIVPLRHLFYWTPFFRNGISSIDADTIGRMTLAGVECICLGIGLATAVVMKRLASGPRTLLMVGLGGYMATVIVGLLLDLREVGVIPPALHFWTWVRASWTIASRAQYLVVPALGFFAALRVR